MHVSGRGTWQRTETPLTVFHAPTSSRDTIFFPPSESLRTSHYVLIPDRFIKILISEKVRNSIEDSKMAPYGTHLSISNITSQWEMLQNPRGCDTLSGCRGEREVVRGLPRRQCSQVSWPDSLPCVWVWLTTGARRWRPSPARPCRCCSWPRDQYRKYFPDNKSRIQAAVGSKNFIIWLYQHPHTLQMSRDRTINIITCY